MAFINTCSTSIFSSPFLPGSECEEQRPLPKPPNSRIGSARVIMLAKKGQSGRFGPGGVTRSSKAKTKLEPESVYYEGRPSWTEVILPFLSIVTVIGIIPFIAALARQAWVKYRITSRRIAVDSGFRGKDHVEVVYRDVKSVKFVRRMAGASADMVIALKDGAKLELRAVQEYVKIFDYIMTKVSEDARVASGAA